ncbi:hypothetical protein Hanom_Chr11g01021711 [Helianthus anomalus]
MALRCLRNRLLRLMWGRLIKKGATPAIQGSSGKSVESLEGPEAEEVYVPNWDVKVGDSFKDPTVCAKVLAHFAPPGVWS